MIKKIKPQIQELGLERFGIKHAKIIQPEVPILDKDGEAVEVVPEGTMYYPLSSDQEKINEIIVELNQLQKLLIEKGILTEVVKEPIVDIITK